MSEQGWREFLVAEGLEDWVVLHGGPAAVFRTETLAAATKLAAAIAVVPGLEAARAQLAIVSGRLTVRLTRDLWRIEVEHVDLARAISEVA